jgi:transposase
MSKRYKEGINRNQQQFFPPSLDELVDESNQVRAVELYVEHLKLKDLGFDDTSTSFEGQKSYSPKLLLKIYIYGYLNKIRSSRTLERENARNIELMWLTQGLKPTYKTISDFRKNNPKALKAVFKDFVLILKGLALIGDELVALDAAFLRANASKTTLIMKKTTQRDLASTEASINEYLTALEFSDKETNTTKLVKQLPRNLDLLLKKKLDLQQS